MTSSARDPMAATFTVRTSDDWTLTDVRAFADVIEDIYGVFLTLRIANQRMASVRTEHGAYAASLYDYVASTATHGAPRDALHQESWSVRTRPTLDAVFGPEARYFEYLYENRYVLAPEAQLRVRSWRMASPGKISLEGLGSCIEQLREFVKDLNYRNRQEKELGDLEIARRRLELAKEMASPVVTDLIATRLLSAGRKYQALESAGKLAPRSEVLWLIEDLSDILAMRLHNKSDLSILNVYTRQMRRYADSDRLKFQQASEQLLAGVRKLESRGDLDLDARFDVEARISEILLAQQRAVSPKSRPAA